MKSSAGKILHNAAVIFVTFILLMPVLYGQTSVLDSSIQLQKADFRGQRPQAALMAAVSASRQDVVVIVVEGGDEALIAETEENLKGLIRNGYTRLGLILCDNLPGDTSPVVVIATDGLDYAIVKDAKPDAQTSADVYKLVRDAYQEYILPKLKIEPDTKNRGGF